MPDEIVVQRPNGLHGELLETGYVLPEGLTYDEWAADGPPLIRMAQSSMFWLGDWLRYGEHHFGEKYAQAADMTGLAVQTLKNAQWVAERIPPGERREDVPFSHHKAVAALDPKPRRELLERAAVEHMSEHHVRQKVHQIKEQEAAAGETVIPPKGDGVRDAAFLVRLHGLDAGSIDEIRDRLERAVRAEFGGGLDSDVEVELDESAGGQ